MPKQTETLIIKLLSGSHMGAEVDLEMGEYLLGSDEDCDLLLHDGDIAPHHLRLTVGNGELRITPLDGPVWLDGIPLTGPHPCDLFQVVSLGITHLAIGPSGSWPHLSLPELRSPDTASPANEDATQLHEIADDTPDEDIPQTPPRRRIRLALPILLVITIIAGLAYLAWPRANRTGAMQLSALEQIKQIITEHEVYGLTLESQNDATVRVSGYVDNTAQRRQLERAFQLSGLPVRSEITAGEDLSEAVRTTLEAMDMPLKVSYQGQGEVQISGPMDDPEHWQEALAMLQRDVPGLRGIDTNFDTPRRKATPTAAPPAPTAEPSVSSTSAPPSDAPPSDAPPSDAPPSDEPDPDAPEISLPLADTGIIARSVSPRTEADEELPVEITLRSVGLQPVPYLITRDGRKFLQGARLRTGHIIKEIQVDRVILRLDDREIIYHLGTSS